MSLTTRTSSAPNFERSTLSAQSSMCSNFRPELLARAHPPYPPGGGAQTSPPARTFSARFKFALKVRRNGPRHGSFRAEKRRRGPREQRPIQNDVISPVRSGFWPSSTGREAPGRAALGHGRTDAAGAYRTTTSPPRWPRGGVSGRLGPTQGPRPARSTMTWRSCDED